MLENADFIAAVVAVLGAIAVFIKSRADVGSIRAERSETKAERDKDSQQMHDDILKLQFQSQRNRDDIALLFQQLADSNKQVSLLTQQLAEVLVKMDNVISTLKELKDDFKNA